MGFVYLLSFKQASICQKGETTTGVARLISDQDNLGKNIIFIFFADWLHLNIL